MRKMPFTRKVFVINLALIILVLGIGELYFVWRDLTGPKGIKVVDWYVKEWLPVHKKYFVRNDLRGYSAEKNVSIRSRKNRITDNKVVYDVLYSTNQYGLRVAPHDLGATQLKPDFKNAIFFGCSATFGEGVNDNENMPFMFEKRSHGRYKAYNFAFPGYGPHQMLRILESGFIGEAVTDRRPAIAVYQILNCQIERSAFKYPYILWDVNGPKYMLDRFGNVVRDPSWKRRFYILEQLAKSRLLKTIIDRAYYKRRTKGDIKLFAEIIKKSAKIFETKYNGKFYIIYWDDDIPATKEIIADLEREKIKIFKLSQIVNEYNSKKMEEFGEKYTIADDGHPNRLLHGRIAAYLLGNIR